jgi:hypothetical protein
MAGSIVQSQKQETQEIGETVVESTTEQDVSVIKKDRKKRANRTRSVNARQSLPSVDQTMDWLTS